MICGPRKGDEIPTLSLLWVMPLKWISVRVKR